MSNIHTTPEKSGTATTDVGAQVPPALQGKRCPECAAMQALHLVLDLPHCRRCGWAGPRPLEVYE